MSYNDLKRAFEAGKARALKSSYYRLMVWPVVQKSLKKALSEAWQNEKISQS